ncbi:hypothetical protein [Streptomyces sp. CAU 1734]|uniref:hypothetical protein n=1 Tax=Streptomyces sp. CAU 1734 TaxID=3140360 RepID=UPI00326199EB
MVTSQHEAAHKIFQERPELLTPVFGVLNIPLPAKTSVEVLTGDVTEIRPLERRVDSVLRVETSDDRRFLLAIEAQGRKDHRKETSWPYYVAYLREKFGLPVLLLVVCKDRATAKWAAGPFTTGFDHWTALSTHPLVLGPDNMPVIISAAEAERNMALATLAVLTHSKDENVSPILEALATAMASADMKSVKYFTQLIEVGLGSTPAGEIWRKLMTVSSYFPGRGTLVEAMLLEGEAQGEAGGRAKSILRVLDKRGVSLTDADRERISGCTDLDVLDQWLDRALEVTDATGLFTETDPLGGSEG